MIEILPRSFPPDGERDPLVAKRSACEELNSGPQAKKFKLFHDGLVNSDYQSKAVVRRVPFPEKVGGNMHKGGNVLTLLSCSLQS